MKRTSDECSSPAKRRQSKRIAGKEETSVNLNDEWSFRNISKYLFSNYLKLISFLMKLNLILSSVKCPDHEIEMELVEDATVQDSYQWKCCQLYCKRTKSIRAQSFFSNSRLSLENILTIAYMWYLGIPQNQVPFEAGLLSINSSRGNKTVSDWYNFCRDVCRESLFKNGQAIGGPGKEVEIDESAFGKRKYNKGKRRPTGFLEASNEDLTKCLPFLSQIEQDAPCGRSYSNTSNPAQQ